MVIINIHEESHGFIGTAATMKAAFQFLIQDNWLTLDFEMYDEATESWYTLKNVFEAKGIEPTKENILAWAMEHADDSTFWDGVFYFDEAIIIKEENWDETLD